MIVNILHFYESISIYNITQDITLTKTTPITGNFFKAAITATTLAIMPIHIFLSIYIELTHSNECGLFFNIA